MAVDQVGPSASEAQRMNSSRDVTLCKQATFGVAMGNAGGEVKHQTTLIMAVRPRHLRQNGLDDRLQDAMR
jgi:hypothetical protein